jgi:Domain of unknown function (DUF4159)
MINKLLGFLILLIFSVSMYGQGNTKLALLKYRGGGDWYADPTALPNISRFCNEELNMDLNPDYATVDVASREIFNYPFLHITGHGNIIFSSEEAENLRNYLMAGGFLYIDDNYGLDPFIRLAMKMVFPDKEFIELPFDHPIYHQAYEFENGLPKIHEHNGKPPQGFAIMHEGRVVCYYTYECDITDGWEDPSVHGDPAEKRLQALQMGANIIQFAFTQ